MKLNHVGIDVSAKTFTAIIDHGGTRTEAFELPNDSKGHKKLIRMATRKGFSARVVLEATGVYSLDLALALHRAERVEVMVANPRTIGQFAGAYLRRSKTDTIDAGIIVEFAIRMEFDPWVPPEPHAFDLRAISRRIEGLIKMATQEKNRLHAASSFDEMSDIVRNDIEVNIRHLERRVGQMREQARRLIAEHSDLECAFGHITSVKGIAEAAGIQILAELAVLPEGMDVRQWVAHAGLDPRVFQSGTSVNKPARISRQGNVHIRRALFLPAIVAAQHEPHVTAFYQKLLGRGKTKMQANVAVMRKLLHAIHGMIKHDKDFEGEKFYAIGA
ncbi:MAG: IS110 family transposase [bacterium]|nr:IS110 family transposase [bacterium]